METFVIEAKRVLAEVERFLAAIANKLPISLDKERSSLLQKILEMKSKHPDDHHSALRRSGSTPVSRDTAPPLPDRRRGSGASSVSSRSSFSSSGPAVPPRPASSICENEVFQETYDVVDADEGFDKKAMTIKENSMSSNQASYLLTRQDRTRSSPVTDDLYEPPNDPSNGDKHNEPHVDYFYMQQANRQVEPTDEQLITEEVYTDMDEGLPSPPATNPTPKANLSDQSTMKRKDITLTKAPITLDSITNPDYTGKLKRKKDKSLVAKWLEQTVVVKDNMLFISDKETSGEVTEFFSLSGAVVESTKVSRQQHTFQIKSMLGKNVCCAAQNAVEMQEWVRVLSRAASKSIVMTNKSKELTKDQANETEPTDDLITEDVYEMPEAEVVQQVQTLIPRIEPDKDEIFIGKYYPEDKRAEMQHIYKAKYDCIGENDDEVTLRRGHLILIDFKDHEDWWVGTTQTPDGKFNGSRGFVPRAYLIPAYECL